MGFAEKHPSLLASLSAFSIALFHYNVKYILHFNRACTTQRCGGEGFSAKGKGLGRSRGRRPGGGAADAGKARISRPEGGLACGPSLYPAAICLARKWIFITLLNGRGILALQKAGGREGTLQEPAQSETRIFGPRTNEGKVGRKNTLQKVPYPAMIKGRTT